MARDRIRQPTVRAYLMAITRNLFRDELRRRRPPSVELDDRTADEQPRADVRAEHLSELRHVHAQLRHVSTGDRRALLLYAFRSLSYAEIAECLGIPIGSVRSRIARARDALRPPAVPDQTRETPS